MPTFQVKFRFLPQAIRLLDSSVFVPILMLALAALLIAGRPSPAEAADQYGLQATDLTILGIDGPVSATGTGVESANGIDLLRSSLQQFIGSATASTQNGSASGAYLDDSSLSNWGTITGTSVSSIAGGANARSSTLTNSGTITGTSNSNMAYGVYAQFGTSTITNSGTITGKSTSSTANGAYLANSSTLTNTGSIYGLTSTGAWAYGVALFSSSTGTNSGTITGTNTSGTAFGVYLDSSTSFTNSGTITGTSGNEAYGVYTGGPATLTNTGTISASGGNRAYGVHVDYDSTFTNSGSVAATSTTSDAYGVYLDASLWASGTLTNTGSISARGAINSYAVFASDSSIVNLDTGTRILNGSVYADDGTSNLNIRSNSDLAFTLGGSWDTITNSGSGIWSLGGATSATTTTLTLNSGSSTTMENGSRLTATTLNLDSGASLDFEKNSLMTVTGTATLNGAIAVDASANNLGSGTYLTAGTLTTGADYSAVARNPNFAVNVTTTTGAGGSVSVATAFAPQDDAASLASTTTLSSSQAFASVAQSRNLGLLADMGDSDEGDEIMVASIGSLNGLLNPRKEETPWGIYLQPVYSFGSRNGDASSKGYDYGMYGLEAGIDRRFGDSWVVGVMAGYGSSHMDFTGSAWVSDDNEDQQLYTGGVYSGYRAGDWTFADTLSVTYADHKSKRKASATDTATAKYQSWLTANEFLAVYHWSPAENWLVTPRAGVNVTHLHRPGFSERGSVNALSYQTLDQFFSEGLVAVNVQRTFMKDDLAVTPYAGLGAVHSLTGNDITVKQYLTTTSAEVTTKNDDSRFTGELGMTFSAGSTNVTLGYAGEYSASSDSHSVFGQMRWEF